MECRSAKYPDENDQHGADEGPRAAEDDRGLVGEDAECVSNHLKKISLGSVFP